MLNIDNDTVIVGLINGRHAIPVDKYIFEKVEDVFDFDKMNAIIVQFLLDVVGITVTSGIGINQSTIYDEVEVFTGAKNLVVYVTGLTAVTAQLIKVCALNGVSLTLMHYNSATDTYMAQKIF